MDYQQQQQQRRSSSVNAAGAGHPWHGMAVVLTELVMGLISLMIPS
jgi:hypothetical protein